jgi:hypothetical protein
MVGVFILCEQRGIIKKINGKILSTKPNTLKMSLKSLETSILGAVSQHRSG